jgi:hypothetical protein
MFNKHVFRFTACCTLAAALIFSAFTPPTNLASKVTSSTKTVVQTVQNPVDCGCTFSSGGCADCICVGGFATGCTAIPSAREGGRLPASSVTMSDNQLRQALKYQRLLLSFDSPESIAAAAQVSQLIEAIKDNKSAEYLLIAEHYGRTVGDLPKGEKEILDTWVDTKRKFLAKTEVDKSPSEAGKN